MSLRDIWHRRVLGRPEQPVEMDAAAGYDLWSATYDRHENLLVALDEAMFVGLLQRVDLRDKCVIDVGCGTGRHWGKLLAGGARATIGYDASGGMLAQLRRKYPRAVTLQTNTGLLPGASDASCDVLISTLVLSHIPSAETAFGEWARVLRTGADVLLTDFHPAAAAVADTSFRSGGRTVRIRNHVRSIAALEGVARSCGLEGLALQETILDDAWKPWYERAGMLREFARLRGVPLLYGMHLRKAS